MRSLPNMMTLLALLLLGATAPEITAAPDRAARRASLKTVEGEVLSVATVPGEGDLPVLAVTLQIGGQPGGPVEVLLAPESTLVEIGFPVEPGDRIRARIFTGEEGPARAHKVWNISQGTMVRFRTLHKTPLWDRTGTWQGRTGRGAAGGRRAGHGGQGERTPPH
jgi:hypothetical protein